MLAHDSFLTGLTEGILDHNIDVQNNERLDVVFENAMKQPREQAQKLRDVVLNLNDKMNEAVWGHFEAKKKIIEIMVQYITNPESKGNCLGIWGPPGNGKTTLIKEGIAKAMDRSFVFISLGGASDASFLEGHSYTYECPKGCGYHLTSMKPTSMKCPKIKKKNNPQYLRHFCY